MDQDKQSFLARQDGPISLSDFSIESSEEGPLGGAMKRRRYSKKEMGRQAYEMLRKAKNKLSAQASRAKAKKKIADLILQVDRLEKENAKSQRKELAQQAEIEVLKAENSALQEQVEVLTIQSDLLATSMECLKKEQADISLTPQYQHSLQQENLKLQQQLSDLSAQLSQANDWIIQQAFDAALCPRP